MSYTIQLLRKERYNSFISIYLKHDDKETRYTTNGGHLLDIIERLLKGNEIRVEFNYQNGDTLIHLTKQQYETILTIIYALQMKKYDLVKAYWHDPSLATLDKITMLCIARRLFTLELCFTV